MLFTRFRSNYHLLPQNSEDTLAPLNIFKFNEAKQSILQQFKTNEVYVLKSQADFCRVDYKEFNNPSMFFLCLTEKLQFQQSGAVHKAEWMAKLLYSIKICLMQNQIEKVPRGKITTKSKLLK